MRFLLPLLALALVLPPTASAEAASTLSIVAPPQGDVNVAIPIEIMLTIQDFACAADTTFTVDLTVSSPGEAAAKLDTTAPAFVVPAGSYLFDPWSGNASANLTVSGEAATTSDEVTIHASFAPTDEGSCVTSGAGGFGASEASVIIHVGSGTPPPPTPTPSPTPPTPTPEPTSPTPEPTPTPATPTNNSTSPTSPSSTNSTANGTVDQLPPGGGYIGDYAPAESSKSTPAPALFALVAAVGVAAIVLARRDRK